MKIAIAVDSDTAIHQGHFGDSPRFVIYEFSDSRWSQVETRTNPFTDEANEKVQHGKVKGITAFLPDCDIFLGSGFGMHSLIKLQHAVRAVWLTRRQSLPEVIQALQQKDAAPFLQFDFSAKKFVPLENPDLLHAR